jgi:hypothetical protein
MAARTNTAVQSENYESSMSGKAMPTQIYQLKEEFVTTIKFYWQLEPTIGPQNKSHESSNA